MKRLERVTEEIAKLKASRQRVLGLVVKDSITDEEATDQLAKLKEREQKLDAERARLDDELAHVPSRAAIQNVATQVAGQFRTYTNARLWAKSRHANEAFDEMTYDERRALCQTVFSGQTADGRRMGVWITWSEDGKKWRYQIDGHLIDASGPASNESFVFGDPKDQKAVVAKSALRSPGRFLLGLRSCAQDLRPYR